MKVKAINIAICGVMGATIKYFFFMDTLKESVLSGIGTSVSVAIATLVEEYIDDRTETDN